MTISIDNALGVHAKALELRAERTEILARNIANADTPGYKARDIDFNSILQAHKSAGTSEPRGGRVMRTDNRHFAADQGPGVDVSLQYRNPIMPSLDGNTVDTQLEQAEFAKNNLQFQASFQFLNSKFKGMITALKGE
ncbi:MAG: flagellar basal body rod protein FlgB [Pseudomonadales bacterium]|jgi:flagellar basal-body rod protein FlgB|nr:flagellar basal body rod protein FlgB [Pseudomonadales bacterium]